MRKLNMNQHQNNDIKFVMSRNNNEVCSNHPNKSADYVIVIEEEDMLYCTVCASKLAHQGFTVVKLDNLVTGGGVNKSIKQAKPLPNYP